MNPLIEALHAQGWLAKLLGWEKFPVAELPDRVIAANIASEAQVLAMLAQLYQVPSITSEGMRMDPSAAQLLDQDLCSYWSLLPLKLEDGRLLAAAVDPWEQDAISYLLLAAGEHLLIDWLVCLNSDMQEAISRSFSNAPIRNAELAEQAESETLTLPGQREFQDSPVVKLVQHLIEQGVNLAASDIHLEPSEEGGTLRFRIDGSLQPFPHPASHMHAACVSRIKVMANLNVSETRLPQDGRISLQVGKRKLDLRVSTLPLAYGEGVVLRILDTSGRSLDLETLGLPVRELGLYNQAVHSPHGLILLAGPTGSGKTTTLYATLKLLNTPDRKIISVEDPIEYRLKGIHQSPVREEVGYSFEMGLRAILRHDPDVVMIGEIRDHVSAEIAVRSALTGHLVLSTLHTNDSVQAVTRLVDMGVPSYLVTAVLRLVLSQRLLRRLCLPCRQATMVDGDILRGFGYDSPELGDQVEAFLPSGCSQCHGLGYSGRVAVYELLEAGRLFRENGLNLQSANELLELAVDRLGMRSLRVAGLDKVLDGTTSLEEVLRVTADS